eukprot:jgi/Tetstr1/451753/TSEL_038789.t1
MSRYDRTPRSGSERTNLYDEITGKIIAELEAGRFPWVQPWGKATAKAPLGLPQNASTGRAYSGINILILWGAVVQHGFPGQGWLTYRQAATLGGNVRKGERGTTVVYADRFTPEDEKRRARETGEEPGTIPFLKRFTVFNAAQCEGLPEDIAVAMPPPPPGLIEPRVEALIKATGIDFRIGGDRAFYVPALDHVVVPPPQAYFEPINWHRTALHELGHYAEVGNEIGVEILDRHEECSRPAPEQPVPLAAVAFEPLHDAMIQRQQSLLAEFALPDVKNAGFNLQVSRIETESFADPKSGHGDQPEERRAGQATQAVDRW